MVIRMMLARSRLRHRCVAGEWICSRNYRPRTRALVINKKWLSTSLSSSPGSPPVLILEEYSPEKEGLSPLPEGSTISILTLNRPQASNAMGRQFVEELKHHLSTFHHPDNLIYNSNSYNYSDDNDSNSSSIVRPCTRCLILTSTSTKVFSAGADLKERATMTLVESEAFVSTLRTIFQQLACIPIPTIAAIEGVAVGGGLELALATDLRIASRTATLGLPETSLGIVPGAGGTQRLSRLIGVARAKELIFTGARINGTTAYQYGLVNRVVEPGDALHAALEMAQTIAQNGPVAIRAAKSAVDRGLGHTTWDEALEEEGRAYTRVLTTHDRLEGLAAFREKRSPVYKNH